jgi:hypothetical protein
MVLIINQAATGAAAQTIVTTTMTPTTPTTGGTFTVADATGYPVTGRFTVVLDREQPTEEKVLITSRSGTTFTVASRGYDDSSAFDHTNGQATCELALPATVVTALINHVDDLEATPHADKLPVGTVAGHDVTARHAFGAALGTPGTPVALTPDIAGTAGTAAQPARADHVHNVPAAAATTITGTNAEGSGASFARNDHNHVIGGTNHIPGAALVNDSVTATQIGVGAVGASEIADGTITSTEFAAQLPKGFVANGRFVSGSNDSAHAPGGATDMTVTVALTSGRTYGVHLHTQCLLGSIAGAYATELDHDGVIVGRFFRCDSAGSETVFIDSTVEYTPGATDASAVLTVKNAAASAGNETMQATVERSLSVYDMGTT